MIKDINSFSLFKVFTVLFAINRIVNYTLKIYIKLIFS